jgi:hypothetical protein
LHLCSRNSDPEAVEATPEVHDLIDELNDLLDPAYDMRQRHGFSIEQLFEPAETRRFTRRRGEALHRPASRSTPWTASGEPSANTTSPASISNPPPRCSRANHPFEPDARHATRG